MLRIVRDFVNYLLALWREWKVLLTGGSIFAILAACALATGKSVPQNVAWLVLGLTFILASFRTWHKERIAGLAASAQEQRIVIEKPAGVLTAFYKEHTEIVARQLVEPYMGKWLRLSGTILDISRGIQNKEGRNVLIQTGKAYIDPHVTLDFTSDWNDRLSVMRKGEPLTAVGQIQNVTGYIVGLKNCELTPADPPKPTPDQSSRPPSPESV